MYTKPAALIQASLRKVSLSPEEWAWLDPCGSWRGLTGHHHALQRLTHVKTLQCASSAQPTRTPSAEDAPGGAGIQDAAGCTLQYPCTWPPANQGVWREGQRRGWWRPSRRWRTAWSAWL